MSCLLSAYVSSYFLMSAVEVYDVRLLANFSGFGFR